MAQKVQATDQTQIRFDFEKAQSQINELTALSSELRQLSSGSYEASVGQVKSAWSGSGSDVFLGKAQELQEKIDAAAAALQKAAESYQEAVRRARSAEEAAEAVIRESGE